MYRATPLVAFLLVGCAAQRLELSSAGVTVPKLLKMENEYWETTRKRHKLPEGATPLDIREIECRKEVIGTMNCKWLLDYRLPNGSTMTLKQKWWIECGKKVNSGEEYCDQPIIV
jgi:hypothetical protein